MDSDSLNGFVCSVYNADRSFEMSARTCLELSESYAAILTVEETLNGISDEVHNITLKVF